MRWKHSAALAAAISFAALTGGCALDGGKALFAKSPSGVETKVVELEIVDENRATLGVGSAPVRMLTNRPGVYDVRRADLDNHVYVLCDAMTSPAALADSVGLGYRVRVVKVISPQADEPGKP